MLQKFPDRPVFRREGDSVTTTRSAGELWPLDFGSSAREVIESRDVIPYNFLKFHSPS